MRFAAKNSGGGWWQLAIGDTALLWSLTPVTTLSINIFKNPVLFSDCPESWERFGDFCYKFFEEKLSWSDAWHDCKDKENVSLTSNFYFLSNVYSLPGTPGLYPQP